MSKCDNQWSKRSWRIFSLKFYIVNIFGFADLMIFITTNLLWCCSMNAATGRQYINQWMQYLTIKLYLQKWAAGNICSADYGQSTCDSEPQIKERGWILWLILCVCVYGGRDKNFCPDSFLVISFEAFCFWVISLLNLVGGNESESMNR